MVDVLVAVEAVEVVIDFLGAPKVEVVDGACDPRVELTFGLITPLSLIFSVGSLSPSFDWTPPAFGIVVLLAFFVICGVAAVPGLAVFGGFFKLSEVFPAIGIDPTDGLLLFRKLLVVVVSFFSSTV